MELELELEEGGGVVVEHKQLFSIFSIFCVGSKLQPEYKTRDYSLRPFVPKSLPGWETRTKGRSQPEQHTFCVVGSAKLIWQIISL